MPRVLGAELSCPRSEVRTWCSQDTIGWKSHSSALAPDRQRTGWGSWGKTKYPIAGEWVAHLCRGLG